METYLVINTETSEVYQRNGAVAEFATFYQARQVRITMNDQGKEVRDIEGTTSTYVSRPTPWQVIEASTVTVNPVETTRSRRIAYGTYTRENVVVHYAKGDLKPIKRNPGSKGRRNNQGQSRDALAREVGILQADVKRFTQRIASIDARISRLEPGPGMMNAIERKVKYTSELTKAKAKLRTAQTALMNKIAKDRKSNNASSQSNGTSGATVVRRKSS